MGTFTRHNSTDQIQNIGFGPSLQKRKSLSISSLYSIQNSDQKPDSNFQIKDLKSIDEVDTPKRFGSSQKGKSLSSSLCSIQNSIGQELDSNLKFIASNESGKPKVAASNKRCGPSLQKGSEFFLGFPKSSLCDEDILVRTQLLRRFIHDGVVPEIKWKPYEYYVSIKEFKELNQEQQEFNLFKFLNRKKRKISEYTELGGLRLLKVGDKIYFHPEHLGELLPANLRKQWDDLKLEYPKDQQYLVFCYANGKKRFGVGVGQIKQISMFDKMAKHASFNKVASSDFSDNEAALSDFSELVHQNYEDYLRAQEDYLHTREDNLRAQYKNLMSFILISEQFNGTEIKNKLLFEQGIYKNKIRFTPLIKALTDIEESSNLAERLTQAIERGLDPSKIVIAISILVSKYLNKVEEAEEVKEVTDNKKSEPLQEALSYIQKRISREKNPSKKFSDLAGYLTQAIKDGCDPSEVKAEVLKKAAEHRDKGFKGFFKLTSLRNTTSLNVLEKTLRLIPSK